MESHFWSRLLLFAEGDAAGAPGMGMMQQVLFIWVPIGFLFWFLLIRPQGQERRRREATLRAVKPNDRVITAGGIYGVVTNVHREADMVTLKVDENNNTKIRVSLAAIAKVLADEPPSESASK